MEAQGAMTGDQFQAARKGLGLTQAQLARELDVALTTIQRWEQRQPPSYAAVLLDGLRARQLAAITAAINQ